MIQLLVVGENELLSRKYADDLKSLNGLAKIRSASSIDEALAELDESSFNVVLFVMTGCTPQSLSTLRKLSARASPARLMAAGLPDESTCLIQCIEAGAINCALRRDTPAEVERKVHATVQGKAYLSPELATALVARLAELNRRLFSRPDEDLHWRIISLTRREQEVLSYIAEGLNDQEIADTLMITRGTVKNHVHRILQKLGVSNRNQAAEVAEYFLRH